jgi:DNA-binding XRE family transcriptional regulator
MPSRQHVKSRYASRIGLRIRQVREARRWTQRDLAARMGVDTSLVSRWENGETLPAFHRLLLLAEVLGIEAGEFFESDGAGRKGGFGERLQLAHELCDGRTRGAVAAVVGIFVDLMEMDEESLDALVGALKLVEGASRAGRRRRGAPHAR